MMSLLAGACYHIPPSRINLSFSDPIATVSFNVTSTDNKSVVIEVRIYERQMNINGLVSQPDVADEFMVYLLQMPL